MNDSVKLERLNIYIKDYIAAKHKMDAAKHEMDAVKYEMDAAKYEMYAAKYKMDAAKYGQNHAVFMMVFVINYYEINKEVVVNALTENSILEEIRAFIVAELKIDMPNALLSGGNRSTKRTTHRKMRKSIIRRRR
jgi:hypothetical protein